MHKPIGKIITRCRGVFFLFFILVIFKPYPITDAIGKIDLLCIPDHRYIALPASRSQIAQIRGRLPALCAHAPHRAFGAVEIDKRDITSKLISAFRACIRIMGDLNVEVIKRYFLLVCNFLSCLLVERAAIGVVRSTTSRAAV